MSEDAAQHNLFRAGPHMRPADAVCAFVILPDGSYLMQLRDDKPGIFFPGHWGLFGGAIDPGETPEEAMYRELEEEINFRPKEIRYFTRVDMDFSPIGDCLRFRLFYEVFLTAEESQGLTLGEGSKMQAFSAPELLINQLVTPYDAFALWLHSVRDQMCPTP